MRTNAILPIVPVYNPEPGLSALCQALVADFGFALVVDDGSCEHVADFDKLPAAVQIVRHEVNRGKGRAIKTGIFWVKEHRPEVKAVVFADGDGQHRPEDVCRVADAALESDHVTLGVRDFSKSGIPFRSRFGNVLTSFLVRCMYKIPIYDTQTGLRAVPARLFDAMLDTAGERYEYEMRLFGMLREKHEELEQVGIETVYIENNRASHFHPIKDSVRVYRGLFGSPFVLFCLSSFIGFLADNAVFTVALLLAQGMGIVRRLAILGSLLLARACSALLNYYCNRRLVFESNSNMRTSFVAYAALAVGVASISYGLTSVLSAVLDVNGVLITIVKIIVETVVFLLSYFIQKKFIFRYER